MILDMFALLRKSLAPQTINFEQLSVTNAAGGVALTAAKYGDAMRAFITVEGSIRFRIDGKAAPTAAIGHLVNSGDRIMLESNEDIVNFRAISTSATPVIINASYSI